MQKSKFSSDGVRLQDIQAIYRGSKLPTFQQLNLLKSTSVPSGRIRLTQLVAGRWTKIGLTLGLTPDQIQCIRVDHHCESYRLCIVLGLWLDNARGMPNSFDYPLSWRGLANMLCDSGCIEEAERFFTILES